MLAAPRDESGRTEIPPARAVLAVCGSARAADRRGARGARPRAARSALRAHAASVFDLARVPEPRRPRLRPRPRARARRRRVPRTWQRRQPPISGAVLAVGRGAPPPGVRNRRPSRHHRSADRRSAGAVRAPALAAARLVLHSTAPTVIAVPPSDIERDLMRLEAELKRLEAEYNMFFSGRLPRPP